MRERLSLAAVSLLPLASQAHPSSVPAEHSSLWHLLSEPDHLLMLALPVVALALYRRRRAKKPQH